MITLVMKPDVKFISWETGAFSYTISFDWGIIFTVAVFDLNLFFLVFLSFQFVICVPVNQAFIREIRLFVFVNAHSTLALSTPRISYKIFEVILIYS